MVKSNKFVVDIEIKLSAANKGVNAKVALSQSFHMLLEHIDAFTLDSWELNLEFDLIREHFLANS